MLWSGSIGVDGSSVLAVAGELVLVDLDAETRTLTDAEGPVDDLQRLGEEIVGHVQEVGQLSGPARGELEGRTERDAAQRTELTVDLIAHHDVHPEPFAQAQYPLRVREAGARRLDAPSGGRPAEQFAGD